MSKTKAKYLIAILLFLVALIFSNTNTVNATTQEEVQKALDLIPNEIYLDIPEIQYEQADDMLKEKVEQIWNDNGIDLNTLGSITYSAYYPYDINRFYEGYVHTGSLRKTVKITYNNTKNKNASDEQYVKNLKLENPKYFEVNLDTWAKNKDIWAWTKKFLENYYSNIINNNSVTLKAFIGSGAGEGLGWGTAGGGLYLNIFKNGKLYDVKYIGEMSFVPVININRFVNLKEAVINEVKKYYPDYAKLIMNVEKGITDENISYVDRYENIENLYTIKVATNEAPNSFVIIRIIDSLLQIKDKTTNIKIDTDTTVLPADTKLVVKELKEETYKVAEKLLTNIVDKMYVYDITLQSEGVEVQPNGKVKVSIPIPNDLEANRLVVYGINDDETKTEYAVTVENGFATFQTDHFSIYVLGEKAEEQQITETTQKNEKDNTPKTGNENVVENAIAILIATIGIIAVIRRTMVGGKI